MVMLYGKFFNLGLTLVRVMLWSGKFFETLIGVRKEPLRELLAKLGVVYVMEPALTVLFVTNMVRVWENVMANLRSQVFRRILIQKVLLPLLLLRPVSEFSFLMFVFI
jgi:hypothetical protein